MGDQHQATCPHCETRFHVLPQQLEQADGRVRCGMCLQVFDARSGEIDFVAPIVPPTTDSHPLAEFDVKPMAMADLPTPKARIHPLSLLLLVGLAVTLALQLQLRLNPTPAATAALELSQLVVRKHPKVDNALRMEAILYNPGTEAAALPELELAFSNRFGEARAARFFSPAEYLHGEYQQTRQLPPNSKLQISLSLQDPGHDAVNFTGRLRTVKQPTH
jgi:predicted Zn finger-like uncharacterized protein